MPGFDGTGPLGGGPMTGRGRGFCVVPYQAVGPERVTAPGAVHPGYLPYGPYGRPRFGFGMRRGWRGRGCRRWW